VAYKQPVSVLVVIHTPQLEVLLLERASHADHWQSVTGSWEPGESLHDTALRETLEETGIDARAHQLRDWQRSQQFEIFHEWRHRYPPGTAFNTEHLFTLQVLEPPPVILSAEHVAHVWLPWQAAAAKVFSWTNRDAILELGSIN
jgi:dATP pyrophosphohydrolase